MTLTIHVESMGSNNPDDSHDTCSHVLCQLDKYHTQVGCTSQFCQKKIHILLHKKISSLSSVTLQIKIKFHDGDAQKYKGFLWSRWSVDCIVYIFDNPACSIQCIRHSMTATLTLALGAYRCHSSGEVIIFIGKNANKNDNFPSRVTSVRF